MHLNAAICICSVILLSENLNALRGISRLLKTLSSINLIFTLNDPAVLAETQVRCVVAVQRSRCLHSSAGGCISEAARIGCLGTSVSVAPSASGALPDACLKKQISAPKETQLASVLSSVTVV